MYQDPNLHLNHMKKPHKKECSCELCTMQSLGKIFGVNEYENVPSDLNYNTSQANHSEIYNGHSDFTGQNNSIKRNYFYSQNDNVGILNNPRNHANNRNFNNMANSNYDVHTANNLNTLKYNYLLNQARQMHNYSQWNNNYQSHNNTPAQNSDYNYNHNSLNMKNQNFGPYGSDKRNIDQNYAELQLEYIKKYAQMFTDDKKDFE